MSLVLTGPFDTSELPRLGVDPVTVTVSRDVTPGHEEDFEAWASDVQKALHEFPGCLGVGVLKAGTAGGRYHIVFRFTDLVALRRWERSPERTALLARLDEHVVATSVRRTVGVDVRAFATRFGRPLDAALPQLAQLEADDLLERTGERLRLTARGLRFADSVWAALV